MSISDTHFLKVSAHVSLKVTTKSSFRGKKRRIFTIFKAIFLKQKQSTASKKFIVSLRNYLVEVGGCFSLKALTKSSFRVKKTLKI